MSTRRTFVTRTLSAAAAAALGSRAMAAEAPPSAPAPASQAQGTDYDVIVVGGGFSGVTAARDCSRNGLRTLLLEARDRLGGRAYDSHFGSQHVELGGTWVHWTQPSIWSEILRYGLTIEETPGAVPDRFVALVDGVRTEFATADKIDEIAAGWISFCEESRVVWERPYDAQFRWQEVVRADQMSAADRLRQLQLTPFQRGILVPTFEAMLHCPIESASYVELLRWNALAVHDFATVFDAGVRYKIKEGTGELVRRVAKDSRAEIRLSMPVRAIAQQGGAVVVTPRDGEPISARAVILALPIKLLNDVEFTPALSSIKREAARSALTSSGVKYYAEVKGRLGKVQLLAPASGAMGMVITAAELPQSTLLSASRPMPMHSTATPRRPCNEGCVCACRTWRYSPARVMRGLTIPTRVAPTQFRLVGSSPRRSSSCSDLKVESSWQAARSASRAGADSWTAPSDAAHGSPTTSRRRCLAEQTDGSLTRLTLQLNQEHPMGRYFQLFCAIDGGIGLAVALGFLALPIGLMHLFTVQLDAPGALFARATGAILLGCSLVLIAYRNAPPSSELAALLSCFGLADLLLGGLFIAAAGSGVMNVLGYGLAAMCLVPAVAFFLFARAVARCATWPSFSSISSPRSPDSLDVAALVPLSPSRRRSNISC